MAMVQKTINDIKNTPINQQEMQKLASMTDDEIDYSDMPEWTEQQIANAKKGSEVFAFMNNEKVASNTVNKAKSKITIQLDNDVMAWLRQDKTGYQNRINNLLRQQMMADLR